MMRYHFLVNAAALPRVYRFFLDGVRRGGLVARGRTAIFRVARLLCLGEDSEHICNAFFLWAHACADGVVIILLRGKMVRLRIVEFARLARLKTPAYFYCSYICARYCVSAGHIKSMCRVYLLLQCSPPDNVQDDELQRWSHINISRQRKKTTEIKATHCMRKVWLPPEPTCGLNSIYSICCPCSYR